MVHLGDCLKSIFFYNVEFPLKNGTMALKTEVSVGKMVHGGLINHTYLTEVKREKEIKERTSH